MVGHDGVPRNLREDFRILYPITLSARIIGQIFGKVIGSVPPIRQYWFDMLNKPDPYEPEKLFKDNYIVVVDPSCIERTVNNEAPFDVDMEGNLHIVHTNSIAQRMLAIPCSLKNHRVLCEYPLKGKEYLPVFDAGSLSEAFLKRSAFPEKVGVYIMRKSIIEKSRGLYYSDQVQLINDANAGLSVAPLCLRAFVDSISIFTSGTCFDGRGEQRWSYARTSDTAVCCNQECQLGIGAYSRIAGVYVHYHAFAHPGVGVVPYASIT